MAMYYLLEIVLLYSALLKYCPNSIDRISEYPASNLGYHYNKNFFLYCVRCNVSKTDSQHKDKGKVERINILNLWRGVIQIIGLNP